MKMFESLTPEKAKIIENQAVEEFLSGKTTNIRNKNDSPDIVFKVKSVFPLELFPDELIIKKDRVTLINRIMPGSNMIRDMHMHDVAQAEADCGPIFGHLHVYPKLRTEEPLLIERLRRKDALAAREIIESLLVREEPRSTY